MLHYFWQLEHLTQGQHYSFLAPWLSAEYDRHNTWLLFTDDDDIWHPQRAFHYQRVGPASLVLQFAKLSTCEHLRACMSKHAMPPLVTTMQAADCLPTQIFGIPH